MAEAHEDVAELPLDSVGVRLRRARETAGLSRADIAAKTKIAERHLHSIEDGNYAALASRTYAVGFSRSYARAVGLDEFAIAQSVRRELGDLPPEEDRRSASTFEPGDPARVPTSRLAWISALVALAVLAGVWIAWRSYLAPGVDLPDLTAPPAAVPAPASPAASSTPAIDPQGAVVFTALEPGVWVKFYDSARTQLMQKEMAQGESYTVPATANGPMIWTGRPEALQISIGGKVVPRLSEVQTTLKDVAVTAAALLARQAPASPSASPAADPSALSPTAIARTPVARMAASRAQPDRPQARRRAAASAASPSVQVPAPGVPAAPAAPGADVPPPATGQSPQTSTVSD